LRRLEATAVKPMMAGGGAALHPAAQAGFSAGFNFDFTGLRIHSGPDVDRAAARLGVPAYAWGSNIAVTPGAAADPRIVAHELAHVVQQNTGQTTDLAATNSPVERRRLEQQAEAAARDVLAGASLPASTRTGQSAVLQGFDPPYHEQSIIGGAAGSFTPEETGKIYEANWRRDFSQASPALADIALIWKQLKDADVPGRPALQLKLAATILAVVVKPDLLAGETYGGYQSFEHMDNPGGAAAGEADARWAGARDAIAGYIQDSRGYIKYNLAQAVRLSRAGWNPPDNDGGKRVGDAWSKGKPPNSYDPGTVSPPQELDSPKPVRDPKESSAVVAQDVTAIAKTQPNATSTPTKGFGADPDIADKLGRASHALEDFFAHSNFIELAQRQAGGEAIGAKDLRTGTFGAGDKAHALADKINAIVATINAHRDLIPANILPDSLLEKFTNLGKTAEAIASITTGPPTGSPNATSHTALNKDEPSRPNFALALQLSTQADHLVFESIHRAMQATLPDASAQIVYDTYAIVDALINVPSDAHPLKSIYHP